MANGAEAAARRPCGSVWSLAGLGRVLMMMALGDEPLSMRNGSMDIELDSGTWVGNVNGWSPSGASPLAPTR
jgi:hypothetical protein